MKWKKTKPPHIGWWLTKYSNLEAWRWWDGEHWSVHVFEKNSIKVATFWAEYKITNLNAQWSAYYPEKARVQRIKP